MAYKVTVLPGDGIGPEVVAEALKVLRAVGAKFNLQWQFSEALIGGIAIDQTGTALPAATLAACRASDAVLLGAIGGPKWDQLPVKERPEAAALLPIRKELGLYANVRPAFLYPALVDASPLKRQVVEGTDLLIIRELTGGLYFGPRLREAMDGGGERAYDTMLYTTVEIERIARLAFSMARQRRGKLTSVDKANVLISSTLWRDTVNKLAPEYPDVALDHMYADNCAMQLIRNPRQFDVIVTENTFGDILSDQAAVLTGSIGMLPSASIGGQVALYEPVHGSAPDIAGQGKANPLATILSGAMMLKYTFKQDAAAAAIERAVDSVLNKGYRTPDIWAEGVAGTLVNTVQMGDLVLQELA